jgi:signal transduction histidine kinase
MEKILQRMESFAKPLLQIKNIAFVFNYDSAIAHVNLSMDQRKNFYLVFKESVNNVLKYSEAKNLEVTIRLNNNKITFIAKDDGIGFDVSQMKIHAAKSLSGNGLNNMKKRAAEMKGECHIGSTPMKGTSVVLKFPVG